MQDMKKIYLLFLIGFLCSCASESKNKYNNEQTVLLLTNGLYLIPDVNYKIIPQSGGIIEGKTNDDGTIILETLNSNIFDIELDFDLYFEIDFMKEFFENFNEKDLKKFEIVYLDYEGDGELKYYLTLESKKKYIILFEHSPQFGISD
jgi:hypothetical protein